MPATMNGQKLPLEDIVLPDPVSWWPPAPGWWILAVLTVAVVVFGIVTWRRRYQSRAYQRQALKELQQFQNDYRQHQDLARFSQDINSLLKRVAMVCAGRKQVSSLSGNAWLRFLKDSGPADFPMETAEHWLVVCYQAESHWPAVSAEALFAMAQTWIKKHSLASKQKRGR